MYVKKYLLLLLVSLYFSCIFCFGTDTLKIIKALRIDEKITIDGELNEPAWGNISSQPENFIQVDPENGKPSRFQTEIKVVYDNSAIYVAAFMHDPSPDSILKELGPRDVGENNADIFAFFLDTYSDKQNAFGFAVSASGVQTDAKFSQEGDDFLWNAVWYSEVKINDKGWVSEFKIPYSAIRFPIKENQIWGITFLRIVRRFREKSSWNFIDKEKNGFVNQFGELHGVENIISPLRLSITPYLATYLEHYPYNSTGKNNTSFFINGGLDLKYGINESFTLDMTLIPDFGEVQSDNKILNLSPFEIKYEENRPFFTEGTDLFKKADVFYSRRVGDQPSGYQSIIDNLKTGDKIISNPRESQMINATKISGRTQKGLGIGFFNTMTSNTYSTLEDSLGNQRKILTEPFSNYNVSVLDQIIGKNSYISIINTNITKKNSLRNADVSATEFKIADGKNKYALSGRAGISHLFLRETYGLPFQYKPGYAYSMRMGKISGNFLWFFARNLIDNHYDPNDLGYLRFNNLVEHILALNYNIYKPFGKFLYLNSEMQVDYSNQYKSGKYTGLGVEGNINTTFSNYLSLGFFYDMNPIRHHDYYEPRVDGRFYSVPQNYTLGFWFSPDYRRRFALDIKSDINLFNEKGRNSFDYDFSPRFRFSDKLLLVYGFNQVIDNQDMGFVKVDTTGEIIFGRRYVESISNSLRLSYIFTNKISLLLRGRHYWSSARYNKFFLLNEQGLTKDELLVSENQNVNFNAFNIDFSFLWEFSPGSELRLVWKNAILREGEDVITNYRKNLITTLDDPQLNSISLKCLYYLDYGMIRKK